MDGLNFAPFVGQEVLVSGIPGLFQIVEVRPPNSPTVPPGWENNVMGSEGGRTVDLRRVGGDSLLRSAPWAWLRYVDEAGVVRHAIEWLRTNPESHRFPDYIVNYEVESGNDHAGNPSIFVRFLVDADYFYENGRVSQEKIAALNEFVYKVQQILLGLGLDRWTYVRSAEAQRALDVAS
jgi:hypothetical protein